MTTYHKNHQKGIACLCTKQKTKTVSFFTLFRVNWGHHDGSTFSGYNLRGKYVFPTRIPEVTVLHATVFHSRNKTNCVSIPSLSTLPDYILDWGEISFRYQSTEQRHAHCLLSKKPPPCVLINLHSMQVNLHLMGKNEFNYIFERRTNFFHVCEISAKSENFNGNKNKGD